MSNRFVEGTKGTSERTGRGQGIEGVDEDQVREIVEMCIEEKKDEEEEALTVKIEQIVQTKMDSMGSQKLDTLALEVN